MGTPIIVQKGPVQTSNHNKCAELIRFVTCKVRCLNPPSLPNLVWNRVGFQGTYGNIWTYLSFQFQTNKKEREICEVQMDFEKFFCWGSNLSDDEIILEASSEIGYGSLRPGLKTGVKNDNLLVRNRVWIWSTWWHTFTVNSQEFPRAYLVPRTAFLGNS